MSEVVTSDSSNQPILVAVDFEPAARAALIFGARQAMRTGVPLKILHVVHEPGDKPNYYRRYGAGNAVLPIEELAEALFKEFLLDVYQSHPELEILEAPDTVLVKGLPGTRIPEVSHLLEAGQIVMGHKKPRGVFSKLFASLSERVANKSGIPVTLVYADGASEDVHVSPHDSNVPGDRGMALGA